jgi:hypothetical protein
VYLRSQILRLVYSNHEYFQREAEYKGPHTPFSEVQDRVAAACGFGNRTRVKDTERKLPCSRKKGVGGEIR